MRQLAALSKRRNKRAVHPPPVRYASPKRVLLLVSRSPMAGGKRGASGAAPAGGAKRARGAPPGPRVRVRADVDPPARLGSLLVVGADATVAELQAEVARCARARATERRAGFLR